MSRRTPMEGAKNINETITKRYRKRSRSAQRFAAISDGPSGVEGMLVATAVPYRPATIPRSDTSVVPPVVGGHAQRLVRLSFLSRAAVVTASAAVMAAAVITSGGHSDANVCAAGSRNANVFVTAQLPGGRGRVLKNARFNGTIPWCRG